jgi:hypothetical protein
MAQVATYTFRDARNVVIEQVLASGVFSRRRKTVLGNRRGSRARRRCAGRSRLSGNGSIDSRRVRSPCGRSSGTAEIAGEVRAGQMFRGEIWPGQCVEIWRPRPVPRGADAV